MAILKPSNRSKLLKQPPVFSGSNISSNKYNDFNIELTKPALVADASNLGIAPKYRAKYNKNDYIGTHEGFIAQLSLDGKTVSINGHKYNLPPEAIRLNEGGNGIGIQQTVDLWWANPKSVSAAMSGGRSPGKRPSGVKNSTATNKAESPKIPKTLSANAPVTVTPLFQGVIIGLQKAFGDNRQPAKIAEINNRVVGQAVGLIINPIAQKIGAGRPVDQNGTLNIYADVLPKGAQSGNVITATGSRYAVRQPNGKLTVFSSGGKAYKNQPNNADALSHLTYDGIPYARENALASRLQGNKPSIRTLPSGEKISVLKDSAGSGVIVTGKDGLARRYKSLSDAEKSSNYDGRSGDNLKWSLLKLADGQQAIIAKDSTGKKFVTLEMENGQGVEFRPSKNAKMYVFDTKQSNDAIAHSEFLGQTRAYLDDWAKVGNFAAGVGRSFPQLLTDMASTFVRYAPLESSGSREISLRTDAEIEQDKKLQARMADTIDRKSKNAFDSMAKSVRANPKSGSYGVGVTTGNIGITIATLFIPGPQEATIAKVGGHALKTGAEATVMSVEATAAANALKAAARAAKLERRTAKFNKFQKISKQIKTDLKAVKSSVKTVGSRVLDRTKIGAKVTIGAQVSVNATALVIKAGVDSIIAKRVSSTITVQNVQEELHKLQANPDKYILDSYYSYFLNAPVSEGAPTSNGHLLQGVQGDGSVYFMRRVPDDLFNVLLEKQKKSGSTSDRVYVVETIKDDKAIAQKVWVEIKPPVRTDRFIGDGSFIKVAKGSTATSFFKKHGLAIGASDQIQLTPILYTKQFNKLATTKKTTLRVGLNRDSKNIVDGVGIRQQLTTLAFKEEVSIGGFTMNGGNFVDLDAPKSYTNGMKIFGGLTKIYWDVGARERRRIDKDLVKGSGFVRQQATGMNEWGIGPEFGGIQTASGKGTTLNGYLEAQLYPLNSFLQRQKDPNTKKGIVKFNRSTFRIPFEVDLAGQITTTNLAPNANIHIPNLVHSVDGFIVDAPNKGKWPVVKDINKPPN